jgi:hypothetical protein
LDPDEAQEIYLARTKIEQSLKDLKNLLRVDRVISKRRENMRKIIAMMLITCSVGLLIGEAIRDEMFIDRRGNSGRPSRGRTPPAGRRPSLTGPLDITPARPSQSHDALQSAKVVYPRPGKNWCKKLAPRPRVV